jgi:hypothetical protein
MKKIARQFQIKTKFEVFLITYALGLGAAERGKDYLALYPGNIGRVYRCCENARGCGTASDFCGRVTRVRQKHTVALSLSKGGYQRQRRPWDVLRQAQHYGVIIC